MRFPNPLKRSREPKELSQGARNRRLIIELAFKWALWFMFAVAIIWGLVSLLLGSSLLVPRSADGVLDSVEMPEHYSWTSESVRLVRLGGTEQQQDAVRSATIDIPKENFQLLTAGVLPERTLYVSDGDYAIRLTESAQLQDSGWALVTDVCNGAEPIPVSTVEMPSAEMIKAAEPKIDTDEGTYLGERAWVLDFEPTPEVISQLLWLGFFDQALGATPEEGDWVMSKAEREKLAAGEYEIEDAKVWVRRDEPRTIGQIDIRVAFNEGSRWRILAQLIPHQEASPLAETDLGEPPCGATAGAAPPAEDLPALP